MWSIKPNEVVVVFPTFGSRTSTGNGWSVSIHGWIFEPEVDSIKRRILLGLLRRSLKLDKESAESRIFKERARAFLVDNERGKRISIRLGQTVYTLPKSGPNGHFEDDIDVPDSAVPNADGNSVRSLSFQAITRDDDRRTFRGSVQLVPETGVSVISDIDDTVKVSSVRNRRELLANTFLREFRSVPKMSQVYRGWAKAGACFHYVSGSPWQLFQPLEGFLRREKFPNGSVHLRLFRLKDKTSLNLLASPEVEKQQVIQQILQRFSRRSFVLIGDSGERDPELYGRLARAFPTQVKRVFIRNVTDESSDSDRFKQAFASLPESKWTLFDTAAGLPRTLDFRTDD